MSQFGLLKKLTFLRWVAFMPLSEIKFYSLSCWERIGHIYKGLYMEFQLDFIFYMCAFLYFWLCHVAYRILAPQSEVELASSAVKAWSPNYWTSREFPVCVSMPGPHCLDYCSFIVNFESWKCESSNFMLFQDYFGYTGFFAFLCEF